MTQRIQFDRTTARIGDQPKNKWHLMRHVPLEEQRRHRPKWWSTYVTSPRVASFLERVEKQ